MRWLELKIPPPIVGLLIAALMVLIARHSPVLALPNALRLPLALVLVAIGVLLDLNGVLAFLRARTTVNPLLPANTSAIVATGVYRVTRNPMYLGMAAMLTGGAVYMAAPLALLGPVAFVAYITRFQIQPEERALLAKFGESYRSYCQRVRRWL